MAKFRIGLGSDFRLNDQKLGLGENNPQERLDVAGVAKGKDLKVAGISSFTAYEGFLRADHQIAENTTLSFDQGPSASLSGEIIVGTGVTVTVERVGLGTATIGVGIGTTDSTTDTTDFTRAGGSEIECLKVFNTFTPPSGGTNDRPYAPKPGELYYNYDFKTIEFFDGFGWRQVDNTTRSSRGVFAGGYAPAPSYTKQTSISSVIITSTGNAVEFGDLVAPARTDHAAMSSSTRGVWHQSIGSPAEGQSLDYVALASGGKAEDFGDLFNVRTRTSALSSSTRGLIVGGYTHPARINAIDYIQISTKGTAKDFGDVEQNSLRPAPIASPTRGVFVGGRNRTPGSRTDAISVVTISSKGDAVDFGGVALFSGAYNAGGISNGVRGIYGGGDVAGGSGKEKSIGYLTLASLGQSQYFGDLTTAGSHHCGTSNATRGIFNTSDQVPNTVVYNNTIEFISISTAGNSIDFGDDIVNAARRACTSDSHGGLGGF